MDLLAAIEAKHQQGAINRRTRSRIKTLRALTVDIVDKAAGKAGNARRAIGDALATFTG
jgi:hypothetical protein